METLTIQKLLSRLSSATTSFTIDLYRHLTKADGTKNIFISPISISIIMGMTYMGARNNTAEQMKKVLKLENMEENVHLAFEEYLKILQEQRSGIILKLANRLYAHNKGSFVEEYLSKSKRHYGSSIVQSDFVNQAEFIRQEINEWVETETGRKIRNLIGEGVLSANTALVLVNAAYFKGDWKHQFDQRDTSERTFTTMTKKSVTVDMMYQKRKFKYGHHKKLDSTILELRYSGEELSMLIILPNEIDGLTFLDESITPDIIATIPKKLHSHKVRVYIPKFKLEYNLDATEALSSLGMKDLFSEPNADLSGINDSNELHVSKVLQKTFINVNEEGSEAAASTAAVVVYRSIEVIPTFRADHPFMFMIRDNRADIILFIGRVLEPPSSAASGNSKEVNASTQSTSRKRKR